MAHAWGFVNRIQHVRNPASGRRKPDPRKALDDALKWTQRATNLLSHHSVIITDTAFLGRVTMHPAHPGHDVQVEVMERVTSRSESHDFPGGASVKLQIQEQGEWRDVEDPREGALSFVRRHGIYTQHRFRDAGDMY